MNTKKLQNSSIDASNLLKSIPTIDYHLTIENHAKRCKKMFDSLYYIIKNDLPKIDSQYAESYMVEMVYNEIAILNASRKCISPAKPFFDYPKLGLHIGSSHTGIHEYNNGKTRDRIAIIRFTNNY